MKDLNSAMLLVQVNSLSFAGYIGVMGQVSAFMGDCGSLME